MPITPFIGVRISWLMLARNSDFSRDASIAWACATARSSSMRLRSVMSLKVITAPVASPVTAASSTIGNAEYSAGNELPSLRHMTSVATRQLPPPCIAL